MMCWPAIVAIVCMCVGLDMAAPPDTTRDESCKDYKDINAVLMLKWQRAFDYYNMKHDNIVNRADCREMFNKLQNNDEYSPISNLVTNWCKQYVVRANLEAVNANADVRGQAVDDTTGFTKEEWVCGLSKRLYDGTLISTITEYKGKLYETLRKCLGEGIQELPETTFTSFEAALGNMYEDQAKTAFHAMSDGKDGIDKEGFTRAYVRYYTDNTVEYSELPLFGPA